ncbi:MULTISPECIES: substrate-binding domain-containing protein [Acidiplasma]|jgi:hypothetical protein|uniref:Uncharacterized protein n=2 Tax=Acidiplasma TaxID=507753 RepID=A0A0N8VL13_9ARCH|nr:MULTISPECIES: hypothetical protein [Acidiplasma]KJE49579.1 hypothetical protein TZ01_00125 [Acidiplasma sp. MBA-1]KPV46817.1 hypothetical protein SE19_03820 [Acidiplasma aeolicum]KQB34380.1 hypothetical protein AOG54_05050 [Acidiplasma aeolicum]KQB35244.1 hypothetical protein AOG55_07260 [Acidiplasma cupricumulans]WMT55875.1 MAG: hypothetical protein RE470_04340 [Acidiplasma sp.]
MNFAVPFFDVISDLTGYIDGTKISMPGQGWFIANHIVSYFYRKNIKTYIETLPAVMVRKRAMGNFLRIGGLRINLTPDIVFLNKNMIKHIKYMKLFDFYKDSIVIATNINDLQLCDIKNYKSGIPNPVYSALGIAFKKIYEKKCGYFGDLKKSSYFSKAHYREIPSLLLKNEINAGILWRSEALYWKFKYIEIPETETVFSVALLNENENSKQVYEALQSGELNIYYDKYECCINKKS